MRRRGAALGLALLLAGPAWGQRPEDVLDQAMRSGDGRSAATAFQLPGLLWAYPLLQRMGLRLQAQHVAEGALDVVTARAGGTGEVREVWFRVAPTVGEAAQADRAMRAVMVSGDGLTPETAFVVGGRIEAEYQVLRTMGIRSEMQALVTVRGCSFDRLSGRDVDTGAVRTVWFKLGRAGFGYEGACTLTP